MSLLRRPLNLYLRLTERTHLARADSPEKLRRSLERKARLLFRAPLGTRFDWIDMAGIRVRQVTARGALGTPILYFHGGGYVFGSPTTHQAMMARLSLLTGRPVLLPAYRKAPEHVFPAPIEDALAIWNALGADASGVVIGGDSAGGGLALALLAECLRLGLPRPAGLFAFSPLTDLRFVAGSVTANAPRDVILPAERVQEMARTYLQDADPADPNASPLLADFTSASPVWLTVGDTEILLDDSRLLAERLQAQGVNVTLRICHDLPHVWPLHQTILPEARATLREVADFVQTSLSMANR